MWRRQEIVTWGKDPSLEGSREVNSQMIIVRNGYHTKEMIDSNQRKRIGALCVEVLMQKKIIVCSLGHVLSVANEATKLWTVLDAWVSNIAK